MITEILSLLNGVPPKLSSFSASFILAR